MASDRRLALPTLRGLSFEQMIVGLLFVAIGATACVMAAQNDTYWHLRAGQIIWTEHAIPLRETFSHSSAGRDWPNHSWAWQALSYGLYALGGFPLLTGAAAAIVLVAHGFTFRLMRGGARLRFLLLALALPLTCLVWALRPQIVSLLMIPLLVTQIEKRRFWILPPLFAVWTNFHGAVALGGVIVGASALVALLAHREHLSRLVPALVLSGLATAFTPMGTELWSFIGTSIGRSTYIKIDEWRAVTLDEFAGVAFYALVAALAVLLARGWRNLRSWGDRVLLAATLVLLPLAVRFGRNIPPFLMVAVPLASRLLARPASVAAPVSAATAIADDDKPRLNLAIFASFVILLSAGVGYAWSQPLRHLGWDRVPPAAVAALESCRGRLYNRYDDGGYLIWFSPRTPVYIDSRQDPYAPEFVATSVTEEYHGVESTLLRQRGMRCAFLPPISPTTKKLEGAGWATRYRDASWLVLEAPW